MIGGGINVVTYAMLQRHAAELPPELARSAVAVRVALTATPDYDSERRLERFFPELIHEITLGEALALELLAPLRVWVAEVDVRGIGVRFVAGDFEADVLGRRWSTSRPTLSW